LSFLAFNSISCAQAPNNKTDVNWLIDVLELRKGSVVADVGAGDGDQTLAIARHIGPEGKIYSTEVGSLRNLRRTVEQSTLSNVTIIEGHPKRTNLPEQCCNAIYMRRVYHHIKYPDEFNNSLWQSLKPGGRLAIIDFEPRGSEANPSGRASGSQHGVTAATAVSELKKAGFKLISSEKGSGRNIYVVVEKQANLNK
jgi:ubiquinone/menaquinone biosynthesis C-methylase UbiE